MHGGGVAGAISRAAGRQLDIESRQYVEENGKIPTGQVGVTGPGNLECKYVIHAVGPVWDSSESEAFNINLLHSAVFNTLKKANELECESVAIPAISSGIFGFPKPLCSKVFFYTLVKFVEVA
jgi:putative ATPase